MISETGFGIWIAFLLTLGYVLFQTLISLVTYYALNETFIPGNLSIELSELLTAFLGLVLIVWYSNKHISFKLRLSLPSIKINIIPMLIVLALGLRLIDDPFFRYENILFKEPLPTAVDLMQFNLTRETFFRITRTVLIIPVLEELFFRKIIFQSLYKKYLNLGFAIIASSIFFSLHHLSVRNAIPALILGILSANLYYKTSNILYSISFHLFFNLIWLGLYIEPENYWKIQEHLNFSLYYWLLIILGFPMVYGALKAIQKINST